MNRKTLNSIWITFGIITGIIILILSFTIKERPFWLDVAQGLWTILYVVSQIWSFVQQKKEKIENVNDDEIKQLLRGGQKKEAIEKVVRDSKCGLLNAISYVADLEKTL